MYVIPEVITPNFFEISQLPYFRLEEPPLDYNLTSKRMLSVRNLTHKHHNILAKIFSYWPKCIQRKDREETPLFKLILIYEMPIMSLQKLTNLIAELHQKSSISQPEWNSLISQIQNYKEQSAKLMDNIMMAEYQIKLSNKKNIAHNIYYNVSDDSFRLKISFKTFSFQVSPYLGKAKFDVDLQKCFIIKNEKIIQKLKQSMFEKLKDNYETNYDEGKSAKYNIKMMQFYEKDLKKMDQNLLQLKLKHNYPLLRQKRYLPIQFADGYDGSQLVDPIVSNKNKLCMFGHFTGYNSNNFSQLQNTYCQICGTQIKQIQQNKLLMFLRNNIYNPTNAPILYCPEFNRFKTVKKCNEVEVASLKIERLMISEEDSDTYNNKQTEADRYQEEHMMNNQQQETEKKQHIVKEVGYTCFMHLCLNVKNMYPLTKNRISTQPTKEVEYINFVYNISSKKHKKGQNIQHYFKQFQLADPARGKYCTHLQFADLRLFYKNAQKKINFFVGQWVYICPICEQEIKDCDLMYLKETLVLIKYMKKLIEPEVQDELIIRQTKKKKIDKHSIRIIINNVEKRVFIEYYHEQNNQRKRELEQLQKLYATLVDPYIHFSQYSLGLYKKSKRLEAIYNFGGNQEEQDTEKLEKLWFGDDKNSFVI